MLVQAWMLSSTRNLPICSINGSNRLLSMGQHSYMRALLSLMIQTGDHQMPAIIIKCPHPMKRQYTSNRTHRAAHSNKWHTISSTHSPQPTPQQQEQRVIYESTPVSDSSTNYRSSLNTYTSLPDAPPMYKKQYILSNGTVQKMDSHHVMLAEPNVAPVPTQSHGHTSPHLENCPTPTGSHVTELTPVQPSVYGQSPYSPHIQITLQQRHPGTTNPSMLYASTEEVERYLNHVEQPASVASSLSSHEPQLTQLTPTTLTSVNSTYASMPPHQFDSYPTYIQGNFGTTSRGIPPYYTSSSPPTWTSAQPPLDPQIQVSSYNSLHNMTQRYGYASTPDIGSRGTGSSTNGSSFSSAPGTRSPNTGLGELQWVSFCSRYGRFSRPEWRSGLAVDPTSINRREQWRHKSTEEVHTGSRSQAR